MGLFKIFSGKSPADFERRGDALMRDQRWGDAKLAFESGLEKLSRRPSTEPDLDQRLRHKIRQSKEALAAVHYRDALTLMDAGCDEDAGELLSVAVELTTDPTLQKDIAGKINQISAGEKPVVFVPSDGIHATASEAEIDDLGDETDGYFEVLLGSLPDDVRLAYSSYGQSFEKGYLALNRGEFKLAIKYLEQAAEENASPLSLVPLELATAYVNLGQGSHARVLLEELTSLQPDLLPAYQLLCEIYWEDKQFDLALQLVDTLPSELAQSKAAFQIRGTTLLLADRNEEAMSYFQDLLQTYGWDQSVALGLAEAHEKLGQPTQALDLYRQLISQCSGCGTRIDPAIRRKYADLSLSAGHYTNEVLEHYLELGRQDPANAALYYRNISRIYSELGNPSESKRFKSIAESLSTDN